MTNFEFTGPNNPDHNQMEEIAPSTEVSLVDKEAKKRKKKEVKEELARQKFLMGSERTLLAWIRTATSLLTLGFALYKLLQARMAEPGEHPVLQFLTPRVIAMMMFGTGAFGLLMAMIRHIGVEKRYNQDAKTIYSAPIMLVAYVILAMLFVLLYGASKSQ